MRCHVCNVAVGDGQRFCHECGASLDGVTEPTEAHEVVTHDAEPAVAPDDEITVTTNPSEPADDLPATEPVEVIATSPPPSDDDALEATEALIVTPAAYPAPAPASAHEPTTTLPAAAVRTGPRFAVTDEFAPPVAGGVEATSQMLVTEPGGLFDGASDAHEYAPVSEGFRLRASFVFAFLAMVATLMASVADVTDIRTTRPVDGIAVGIRALDDFGSNLAVAGFIGAALMLIGGLLSCFGLRWGSGLAGGAGLSMTGWAAVTLGLVEAPIHAAEGVTLNASEVASFTLSVTRDLGYFLILAIGILGLVVFIVSLRMAGTGGRGGLNPWIAAVGALASVVLAAGPLITLGGAPLDANLGTIGIPKEFFVGRLVQLGLIVVTGVVGFLSVRTYGLGLAAGGLGVATWMWVTSLAELGDLPVSVAVGNLGTRDTTPHAVTTVGVTASLAMLLIAATVATATRRRA